MSGSLISLAIVLTAMSVAAGAQTTDGLAARIDSYLAAFQADGHLSGTILVADGERTLYERSFGMADHELGVPNGPGIKHCVASITKPMTIVVLARLIEEGKLAREDPLSKWLPGFPSGDRITVEDLARHRAGIPHRLTEPSEQISPTTAARMAELAAETPFTFEPGSDSSYSSGGFSVLARVLELAGGYDYQKLLEEYVLAPAGMTETAHADSRGLLPGRASSYFIQADGNLVNAPPRDLSFLVGAGSVYSTSRDLLAMMRTLLAGGYGEAATEALVRDDGLRWNGVTHGFRAFADYHADSGVFVVFTSNLQTGAGNLIRRDLPRIVGGQEVVDPEPLEIEPAEVAPSILGRYTGDYQLRPGSTIELHVVDGRLLANEWFLVPLSETRFFSPQDYAYITIVFADDGSVERLDWEIAGTVYPLPRIAIADDAPAEQP